MFQNDKFFSLHARNLYTFLNHSFHIIFTNISKQFARCLTNKPINQLGVRKDSILCAFFTTSCRCEIAGYCLPTLIPAPRQNLLLMTYSNLCNPEECCRDSLKSSISSWHPDFTLWGNLHLPPEGQAYLGRGLFIPTCSTNNFHTSNVHSFVTYYFFLFAAIIQYDVTSLYPIFWREREREILISKNIFQRSVRKITICSLGEMEWRRILLLTKHLLHVGHVDFCNSFSNVEFSSTNHKLYCST